MFVVPAGKRLWEVLPGEPDVDTATYSVAVTFAYCFADMKIIDDGQATRRRNHDAFWGALERMHSDIRICNGFLDVLSKMATWLPDDRASAVAGQEEVKALVKEK